MPVPALPVRKTFLSLFSSRSIISLFSLFSSKSVGASILVFFWLSRLFLLAFLKKVLKVEDSSDFVFFVVLLICFGLDFRLLYYIIKRIRRGYVLVFIVFYLISNITTSLEDEILGIYYAWITSTVPWSHNYFTFVIISALFFGKQMTRYYFIFLNNYGCNYKTDN